MRELVPDEVADDFDVLAEAYDEVVQRALRAGVLGQGGDPEEAEEIDQILDSPELVEAQENVDAWTDKNCT